MINKLIKLKEDIRIAIDDSDSPILAWSGGKDSTFILRLIQSTGYNIPVLVFPHFWNKYQREFIYSVVDEYHLTAFYFSPIDIRFQGSFITASYWVAGKLLTVVMDYIPGKECGIDIGEKAKIDSDKQPGYLWDLTITGTKKTDTHKAVKSFDFPDHPNHKFITPLSNWTDEEVLECCKELGFKIDDRVYKESDELADTGNFVACMSCIGVEKTYCPKTKTMIKGV